MDSLMQDLRYGVRTLLRGRPVFSLVIVATLARGIGATTAMFSVVNAVLLRPLPFDDPDRLVYIQSAPMTNEMGSFPDSYLDWATDVRTLSGVVAYFEPSGVNLSGTMGAPVRVGAAEVTTDFFDVLGVKPIRGRGFTPEEPESREVGAAMISQRLWRGRFGSDPKILGTELVLNGRSFRVVGIVPADVSVPPDVDVWIPIEFGPNRIMKGAIAHNVLTRMAPGVTREEAQAELDALHAARNPPPAPTGRPYCSSEGSLLGASATPSGSCWARSGSYC